MAEGKPGTGRRGSLLAVYLMSDVQGSPLMVRELLDWLSKVEKTEVTIRENDDNALNMIMKPDGVKIENLIVQEELPEEYTLEEIRAAVEDWSAVLDEIGREKPV